MHQHHTPHHTYISHATPHNTRPHTYFNTRAARHPPVSYHHTHCTHTLIPTSLSMPLPHRRCDSCAADLPHFVWFTDACTLKIIYELKYCFWYSFTVLSLLLWSLL